jgi:FixJ family two-component response regulator
MNHDPFRFYIVDDDVEYLKSLKRLLMSAGYSPEVFNSSQSFLDSVPIAFIRGVLILDLHMPGMDGFALQKKLKELRCLLKIIIITADAQPGNRDIALSLGAIGFLQKPFNDESLFELIEKARAEEN